jgi:autotransporter-associated beta strand protein
MKRKIQSLTYFTSVALILPGAADVIYSNLQDISIPANFDGVFLNVETGAWNNDTNAPVSGWDLNPFFGGTVLWNAPDFQPVRSGTSETSAVLNLATGTTVNGSSVISTFVQGAGGANPGGAGYGASETHMGAGAGQFVSGSEGYIGFKLNGSNYGYMRVVFDSTGAGTIKDWAYDNSGADIYVGNVKRTGTNVVTLDSTAGAFTVSAITDSAGAINLIKAGSNTATISGSSTYTGTTTVSAGTLLVTGALGSTGTNTGAVSVSSGASLGGTGDIYGSVTFDGGSYLAIQNIADPLKVTGSVTFGAGFGIDNLTGIDWDSLALDTPYTLISDTSTTFSASNIDNFGLANKFAVGSLGNFAYFQNGSLAIVVVPEPSTTLLGATGLLALALRRRRHA